MELKTIVLTMNEIRESINRFLGMEINSIEMDNFDDEANIGFQFHAKTLDENTRKALETLLSGALSEDEVISIIEGIEKSLSSIGFYYHMLGATETSKILDKVFNVESKKIFYDSFDSEVYIVLRE